MFHFRLLYKMLYNSRSDIIQETCSVCRCVLVHTYSYNNIHFVYEFIKYPYTPPHSTQQRDAAPNVAGNVTLHPMSRSRAKPRPPWVVWVSRASAFLWALPARPLFFALANTGPAPSAPANPVRAGVAKSYQRQVSPSERPRD